MPQRYRSQDRHRDTKDILGEAGGSGQAGREGGRLSRRIGSRDEMKRAFERPAGATRVTKSMQDEQGGDDDEA